MPNIAGCGFKKILKRTPTTCACCKNKLICGIDIGDIQKNLITHNKKHIELRDKGVLIWPSKLTVVLSGTIVIFLNGFLLPIRS